MFEIEINADDLDDKPSGIIKALGSIIRAEWEVGLALAYFPEGFSGIEGAINDVHNRLKDIDEALRLEAENIAISKGAEPYNLVTFLTIFNDAIATVEIGKRDKQ